jgi:phosphoribosylformylglycinamidine synthase
MLVVAKAGFEDRVIELFQRWELETAVIGRVTDDGLVRVLDGSEEVACLPVALCTDPPLYRRQGVPNAALQELHEFNFASLLDVDRLPRFVEAGFRPAEAALLYVLAGPNICSKRAIYRQYDHQVLTNTTQGPGGDAAVLRLKGTDRGIALTLDGNSRFCYLDPFVGGAIAVAEAARNLVCSGAEPLALTNCLNFGNPEKADVYYQLEHAIRGMAAASEKLGTPVVSGNVSLYNETDGEPIAPTPIVGMVGLLGRIDRQRRPGFRHPGDIAVLIGSPAESEAASLAGSEYAVRVHDVLAGRPAIDLDLEVRLQSCCTLAIREGLIVSAHDCSEGGLAVALTESCLQGDLGLDAAELQTSGRVDAFLFGEGQSRIVVSVRPDSFAALIELASRFQIPCCRLGIVTGDRLRISDQVDLAVEDLRSVYESAFETALTGA